ncbi:HD domain-containing protein [Adhaeretor mobilis]|uniref:HD/PDEase domain-containing protein n=1 Tax=Adhaeretor mobilis TaxID=1930276 RepID=A0A517MXV4_9BACT|nr:HD domain-containing protein [Adhaeretor mobilis]QDS99712.1 hypothetical protein HG15A2_30410 [Adhaeretor mobilis]
MEHSKLRRKIAWQAARLLYDRQETDCYQAKMKAARRLIRGWVKTSDLPKDAEVTVQLQLFSGDYSAQRSRFDEEEARWELMRLLLLPCESVSQNLREHPEGDVLYHSLQVFDLAREQLPYDEEFLTAALLHDVGKAIDVRSSSTAGLEALGDYVSERTCWLVENLAEARKITDGSGGLRSRRRLKQSPNFEELMLLEQCDRQGRVAGIPASTLDEALHYLRELSAMCS